MDVCTQSPVRLPTMQDQISLTLKWGSVSGWGREHVRIVFASKGSHFLIYGFVQPITKLDYQNATAWFIDTPVALNLGMGQGACCYCLCHKRQPILHLWILSTNHQGHSPRWKAKNGSRSVDAYFQIRAVTLSLSLLHITAATMSVIHNSDQIACQLSYL